MRAKPKFKRAGAKRTLSRGSIVASRETRNCDSPERSGRKNVSPGINRPSKGCA